MFLWGLENGWKEGLTRLDFKIWYIVDDKKTVERGLLLCVELAACPAKPQRLGALPAPSDIFLITLITTIVSGPRLSIDWLDSKFALHDLGKNDKGRGIVP